MDEMDSIFSIRGACVTFILPHGGPWVYRKKHLADQSRRAAHRLSPVGASECDVTASCGVFKCYHPWMAIGWIFATDNFRSE
jgi:hypothetical protein